MEEEEKQKMIAEFLPHIEKVMKTAADPNWKSLKKKADHEIFWMRSDEYPFVFVKGEGVVDATMQEVYDFLQDFNQASSIDPMFKEGKIASILGGTHVLVYAAFYMPPMISSRDFVFHGYDAILENGVGVSVGRSVEHGSLPERHGYVRASINTSGYIYKAVEGDPSKTHVQYIVNVDPKGWLPVWIVNLAASDQGSNIKRVQEHFAKRKGETKKEKKKKQQKEQENVKSDQD